MKRALDICGTVALCAAVTACSNLAPTRNEPSGAALPERHDEAGVPEMTPGEIEEPYAPGETALPGGRRENLTCFSGNDDRQARIGVVLVNDQVAYFAFYSKSRPRTCSLEAGRGNPYSRWDDNESYSTVTLADDKGKLQIEHKGDAYRFAFFDVDRGRYCGMPGKINGSLTVTRGDGSCVVLGVMDGHSL